MSKIPGTIPPGHEAQRIRIIESKLQDRDETINRIERSLAEGNSRFEAQTKADVALAEKINATRMEMQKALTDATAPKPIPIWKIAGLIFTVVLALIAAAKAVGESNKTIQEFGRRVSGIESDMAGVKSKQSETTTELRLLRQSQESQAKQQTEILDELRSGKRRRRRR